ncbi:MAG: hypothetical protein FWD42_00010 [Solirubrobacterales bacterium]|nr:hypothetical protein [Solirubrobacterales bacterium]
MAGCGCLALSCPGVAGAAFGGATLLSGTSSTQFEHPQEFEDAQTPAVSRDGEYAAFQGSLVGVAGVWRRDLSTGAIEPVATAYAQGSPALSAPTPALSAPGATAPSISASGRYVAFTTTADLEPEHTGRDGEPEGEPPADAGCPEVYVRDMAKQPGQAGAFVLASALSGGEGITFAGCAGARLAGAQAAPGVALSDDGQIVVFTVLNSSNLARGAGCPEAKPLRECAPETPASQVVVHDIETGATTLVSVTPQGQPTPGGGAFPSQQSEKLTFGIGASGGLGDEPTGSTAAISGDASTVAWLGTDVPAQVPGSAAEIEERTAHNQGEDPAGFEAEPLWRRVADGPGALTRRLLSEAGLDMFFSRDESIEIVRGGSFVDVGSAPVFIAPALSETGETVAFVANAPLPEAVTSIRLAGELPQSDAYVVRVDDDPAAKPQVLQLTATPDYDVKGSGAYGFIKDIAISPDGTRVAFDSERDTMVLPQGMSLISPTAGGRESQTYLANLSLGTLQRATVTYTGAEPSGGAGALSLAGEGGALVFASSATNLFYGDAVQASQVYETHELPSEEAPAPQQVSQLPLEPQAAPEWLLDATATAQPDGGVIVYAQVPGAGRLAASAIAQLPAPAPRKRTKRRAHRRGRGGPGGRAGKAVGAGAESRPRAAHGGGAEVLTRTLAQGQIAADAAAPVQLRLTAAAAYRALVNAKHGVYAIVRVVFTAPGHAALTREIPVTFHRAQRAGARVLAPASSTAKHRRGKPREVKR